jgi:hypothetical protein
VAIAYLGWDPVPKPLTTIGGRPAWLVSECAEWKARRRDRRQTTRTRRARLGVDVDAISAREAHVESAARRWP